MLLSGITALLLCTAGAENICCEEDFENAPLGATPSGWQPFRASASPVAAVVEPGANGSARCLKMSPSNEGGFVALSRSLDPPQDRVWVEFSFAFTGARGRTFNLWSHEPGGKDASQINICIERGRLMQYDGETRSWQFITDAVKSSPDLAHPVWHRMRIVAERDNPNIDFYLSAPGELTLPEKPTTAMRAYRTGLPIGAIDLVSGSRIVQGGAYLIDDLLVRGGKDLSGLQGEVQVPERYPLWDPDVPVPTAAQAPLVTGVRFEVVKKREMQVDGFNWLHGMAAIHHNGVLYTCWGHNKGDENTPTEITQGRHSLDEGRTWSPVWRIASHTETEGRSHGVFLSHGDDLWVFVGRFGKAFADLRAEAFVLDAPADAPPSDTPAWTPRGIVAKQFWPCDEPRRMRDGNWVMAGMDIPEGPKWANPAVAISHGGDFTQWDTVILPVPNARHDIWGESTVIVEPEELTLIVRPGWAHSNALVSTSTDCGRTWSDLEWATLPTPSTKLYAGVLSTGQRYVVGTLVIDHRRKRHPLCIAVSKPGEKQLSRMFRIRDDVFPGGPGESVKNAALSYPYAAEHDGHLYVVYSNDGGRGHNLNSGEMAVISIASLRQ